MQVMGNGKSTRKKTMGLWPLLLAGLFGSACATTPDSAPPPPTVPWVDVARYQGKWYEIARLPMWFQRNCVQSQATYAIPEPGRISVKNECTTRSGDRQVADGYAVVVDPQTNSKLDVAFDNFFSRLFPSLTKGQYWIFYLDPEYLSAIVGNLNRKYLWILARTPVLEDSHYQELAQFAHKLGFPTEPLIRSPAPPSGK